MVEYIPSHIRRRRKVVSELEYENADLRRRLSMVTGELDKANAKLRDLATFGAYVAEACREVDRRCGIITSKAAASMGSSSKALAVELHAATQMPGRKTLYIADRKYSRKESEGDD